MVRLKEKNTPEVKSKVTLFQFLMVRLKVFGGRWTEPQSLYFNSLWCD